MLTRKVPVRPLLLWFYPLFPNSFFAHFFPLKSHFGPKLPSLISSPEPVDATVARPQDFYFPLCVFFFVSPHFSTFSLSVKPALSSTPRHFHPLVHLLQCIKYASGFEASGSECRQIRRSFLCRGGNAGIWLLSSLLAGGIGTCSEKFRANNLQPGSAPLACLIRGLVSSPAPAWRCTLPFLLSM